MTAEQIAGMAKRRLRLKIPKLTVALKDHQMSEHHRWLIEQSVEHSRTVDQQVEAIENRIKEKLKPYRSAYELLLTIPGITQNNAPAILSLRSGRTWASLLQAITCAAGPESAPATTGRRA